jgi:hypothetical protein
MSPGPKLKCFFLRGLISDILWAAMQILHSQGNIGVVFGQEDQIAGIDSGYAYAKAMRFMCGCMINGFEMGFEVQL